jgi:predicted small lipoprotein YifL
MNKRTHTFVAIAALMSLAGCGSSSKSSLPTGSERVELDPADFSTTIDNPYWPMRPGSKWVYRETDGKGGEQRVEVTVTSETKMIAGIEARVVHDIVTEDGEPVEDTLDWYAQDADGNIWYLGEDTKEYENGKVKSTAGSWQAGVDGAQGGVIVPADPKPGLTYREEYYAGEAEDTAQVLSVDERAQVPFGRFEHVLLTKNYTPLEPNLVEHKFYAKGVGPVLALTVSGGSDREELVSYSK